MSRIPAIRQAPRFRSVASVALAGWLGFGAAGAALAQSPACQRIAQQLNDLSLRADQSRNAAVEQQVAAQQSEIQRVIGALRQLDCRRPAGGYPDERPAQCFALEQRLQGLRQSMARLQRQGLQSDRAAFAARRQTLLGAYDSYGCTDPIFDGDAASSPDYRTADPLYDDPRLPPPGLPGGVPGRSGVTIGSAPVSPYGGALPPAPGGPDDQGDPGSSVTIDGGAPASPLAPPEQQGFAGRQPVCVRLCDGFFFPVAGASSPAQAQDICQAQCPQAQATLFLRTPGGEIGDATDLQGRPYSALPNALKYRTKADDSCSCKRADQSWGAALKPAEEKLGKHDDELTVTQKNAADVAAGKVKVPGEPEPLKSPAKPKQNVRIIDTSKPKSP